MSRVFSWLQQRERRVFYWMNRRLRHSALNVLFHAATHLGGAAFTIAAALSLSLFGSGSLQWIGLHCCATLALSHIPVAVMKRVYPRLRPYLDLPGIHTCKNPLTDHSFPSGHTTACFAIALPIAYALPWLSPILLPVAFFVGLSRIYLGLHYPSDCLAGLLIAAAAAWATAPFIG
ncbi:phosphatase PAP2 family protein [Paenibacillus doosanensis]|uniref:phosphatase PAP2 family protein n=1 Tax=Paenibacillus doosanensis TaxID=1229154 RepID=UPI0021801FD1|nr:phosphatase PAP2 family protein [Paenibacillus doosanensis]MCS7462986.1 phosphatase PAP2 family protein [Paenibacillus doosanensis]